MFLPLPLTFLQQFCAEQLTLYTYQNYIEIFIFSIIIYKCLRWLQSDYTKTMILYVYAYCGVLISSHAVHASVLFWTLLICSPIVAILCIIVHQINLQKYFAHTAMSTFQAQALPDKNWIEILLRSVLFAAHHKKNIFCIITGNDHVGHFLQAPYTLNIAIQKEALDLIMASSMIENPSIMVVDRFGNLKYINATWSDRMHQHMITTGNHSSLQHCQYAASIISNCTDAIVWQIDPISKQATTWYQDGVIENLSIDQLLTICKKMLPKQSLEQGPVIKGEFNVSKSRSNHPTPPQH